MNEENILTWETSAYRVEVVDNPFNPYYCTLLRVRDDQSRPLSPPEERFYQLPWWKRIYIRVIYHYLNVIRIYHIVKNDSSYFKTPRIY